MRLEKLLEPLVHSDPLRNIWYSPNHVGMYEFSTSVARSEILALTLQRCGEPVTPKVRGVTPLNLLEALAHFETDPQLQVAVLNLLALYQEKEKV